MEKIRRTNKQKLELFNMETLQLKIPKDHEIDLEKSNLAKGKIVFKKKIGTYNEILKSLYSKEYFWINNLDSLRSSQIFIPSLSNKHFINRWDICTSCKHAIKLRAINMLLNVAKYLNDDWTPNWTFGAERKFKLYLENEKIGIDCNITECGSGVYFKSEEAANQALEILGEETIKQALSTDW